jgi:hypothetical protein
MPGMAIFNIKPCRNYCAVSEIAGLISLEFAYASVEGDGKNGTGMGNFEVIKPFR